jgi:transcriptional regulator
MSDDELAEQIEALSAKFENWLRRRSPGLSSKMTAGRLDAMKKAIVGLVMTVEEVEGSFKLNQHKSDADYAAIAGRWRRRPTPMRSRSRKLMRAARPQAFATDDSLKRTKRTIERNVP